MVLKVLEFGIQIQSLFGNRNLHPKGFLRALLNRPLLLASPEGIRFPMQPLHLHLIALLITLGSSTVFDVWGDVSAVSIFITLKVIALSPFGVLLVSNRGINSNSV
jgi:hypothetical protein